MSEATPTPRLDTQHGFLKRIIQNQFDRDNYDREVKAKQTEKKHAPKNKKPTVGVYIPPVKQNPQKEDRILFSLEFEDKDGSIVVQPVFCGDRAGVIARKLATERNLPPEIAKALEERLKFEISQRQLDLSTL